MQSQFRFSRFTVFLMLLILASVVLTIAKASSIAGDTLGSAWRTVASVLVFMLLSMCTAAAAVMAIPHTLRRSGGRSRNASHHAVRHGSAEQAMRKIACARRETPKVPARFFAMKPLEADIDLALGPAVQQRLQTEDARRGLELRRGKSAE